MIGNILCVACGGALGAIARYGIFIALPPNTPSAIAWGTLLVNVLGSSLIGVLSVWLFHFQSERLSLILITGFLGGFTTFSAFSLDFLRMIEHGNIAGALVYAGATLLLCFAGVMLGALLARSTFGV